jgi:hypothetical protein
MIHTFLMLLKSKELISHILAELAHVLPVQQRLSLAL